MNNIPENCRDCEHKNACHAPYYGGSMCKHEGEINRKAINEILSGTSKN